MNTRIALMLLSIASLCSGAAEPKLPLFDIIWGITTQRTRAETSAPESKAALEKIRKLIGEYAENLKTVSATVIRLSSAGAGGMKTIRCDKEGIIQTLAQHDITP